MNAHSRHLPALTPNTERSELELPGLPLHLSGPRSGLEIDPRSYQAARSVQSFAPIPNLMKVPRGSRTRVQRDAEGLGARANAHTHTHARIRAHTHTHTHATSADGRTDGQTGRPTERQTNSKINQHLITRVSSRHAGVWSTEMPAWDVPDLRILKTVW